MKHLKRNILAITIASIHIMGSGYNVHALETKKTSQNIVRTITYKEVTGNSVNVRTGPSTSYKSIMKLNKGYKVEYITSSGNWSKIRYNGKEGYISNKYIKSVSNTSTSNDVRLITGNSVNFRKGPGTNYSVIRSFSKGTKVEFISKENDWIKVNYNGTVGYVYSKYVSDKTNTNEPSTDNNTTNNNTSNDIRLITGNSVNFRKGPGTSYSVIRSFSKGTKVEFISKENDWIKVNYNGTVGYVFGKYVSDKTNTNEPTTDDNTSTTTKYVTGNSVNFRKGPGTSYSVIRKFSKGTQVEFISNDGDWSKIKHNGTIGYISSKYLSSTNPAEIQGKVLFPDWFDGGKDVLVRDDYAKNLNNAFTVEDYKTGKTFKAIRTGGTNHADVEPLTAEDTAIMKSIWGGFSWTRRPVLIHIDGKIYGASMTGMPHAGLDSEPAREYTSKNRSDGYGAGINYDSVKNNNADGHVDIHFLNSKTHSSNKLDTAHQNNIKTLMSEFN